MKPVMKTVVAFVIVTVVVLGAVVARYFKGDSSPQCLDYATAMGGDLPILMEFGGGTCPPCKAMAPIIAELHTEYGDKISVGYLDVKKEPVMAKAHDIQKIPAQVFFDAYGAELFRHVGVLSKEDIVAKWKELGFDLDEVK